MRKRRKLRKIAKLRKFVNLVARVFTTREEDGSCVYAAGTRAAGGQAAGAKHDHRSTKIRR